MINYYIPGFYCHYNVNMTLLTLMQKEPQMFYEDIRIGAIFDNFPNCLWNGGTISFGKMISAKEQIKIMNDFNSLGIPLRLTMTNPLIEEKDCYDRYANYIMENLNNGFNQVLVASPILEEHIRKTYPHFPIVRSIIASNNEKNIYYDDSNKYFMSVLNRNKNSDIDFLKKIKNKQKIEILVNETCVSNCPRSYEHYKEYGKVQKLKDNNKNEIINLSCDFKENKKYLYKIKQESKNCISRQKIKEIYEPLGFVHFKLSGRQSFFPITLDYANHFVKPEWKDDFLSMILRSFVLDYKRSFNE